MGEAIIDAWIQHPSGAFLRHEMFASLRRWMKLDVLGLSEETRRLFLYENAARVFGRG